MKLNVIIIFCCILLNISLASPADCIEVWEQGVGLEADLNRDCYVNLDDLAVFASQWQRCYDLSISCEYDLLSDSMEVLFDGNTLTEYTVSEGICIVPLDINGEIVSFDFFVVADEDGEFVVSLDDTMDRTVEYTAGRSWCNLRIPYSQSTNMELSFSTSLSLGEIKPNKRTAVKNTWPQQDVRTYDVTLDLAVSADPECDYSLGIMCNWFERGVVEGIKHSTTRTELIEELTEMGIQAWRYPGGTMTYGYPPTREAIAVFQDAGLCSYCYGLCKSPLYWASPEEFLDFCKAAGITAWYEINPGFWYDSENQQVHKTVPMDNRGDVTATDYLDEAVADAVAFALYADLIGVDVVWEIGNEDYVYYKPATYANLCEAFIQGIRASLPDAKFAVCGDGYSWSDHSFADEFKVALAGKDISGILDYSSEHLYLSGVGYTDIDGWHEFDWYTASGHGDAVVSAWPIIRPQYTGSIADWKDVGYTQTKLAMTEFNTRSGNKDVSLDVEHSVGRALGEAQTIVNMIDDGTSSIFLHDMVRTSPDSAWFARLDYYPDNPAGRRYFLFPEARAVSLTARHGQGNLVLNSEGLTVSRHNNSVYMTAINRGDTYKEVTVNLTGVTVNAGIESIWETFRAASEESCFFDYYFTTDSKVLFGETVTIKAYPFSIVAVEIPVH